jgi:hypothetical protein
MTLLARQEQSSAKQYLKLGIETIETIETTREHKKADSPIDYFNLPPRD